MLLAALSWLLLMQAVRNVAKRQARSRFGVHTARMAEWHVRAILLLALPLMALSVPDLRDACYAIALALLTCHFCFKACDTPPPQPRRDLA
ncbi:MAG: hypothetical protein JWO25_2668 [Alphaproteobacteria bacterium]|nr:hypothetical protein [Alphaproteobacteria bacterium]